MKLTRAAGRRGRNSICIFARTGVPWRNKDLLDCDDDGLARRGLLELAKFQSEPGNLA